MNENSQGDIQETIRDWGNREDSLNKKRRAAELGLPKGSVPPPYQHLDYPKMLYKFVPQKGKEEPVRIEKTVKSAHEEAVAKKLGFELESVLPEVEATK